MFCVVGYGVSEGGYIDNLVFDWCDVNWMWIVGGCVMLWFDVGNGWMVDFGGIG